jgi:DNA-binding transcriptional LysR family regulator
LVPVPPSLKSFDLNLLVLFDALYRQRKLSEAAAAVGLSQPAASQALSRLREAFDDPLFVRRGVGMEPSAMARTLAPMVDEALRSVERGLKAVQSFDPAESDREFRLALGELGQVAVLAGIVSRLSKAAPGVRVVSVRGTREELTAQVARGEVDLSVDFLPPTHESLRHERIAEEELVVIARRGHPRVRGSLSLEQFLAEPRVGVDIDPAIRQLIGQMLNVAILSQFRFLCQCAHYSSVPSVVLETDAIATVPRAMIASPLYAGRFQIFDPPLPLFKIPVYVIWHASFESDPGHAWLRAQLLRRYWAE